MIEAKAIKPRSRISIFGISFFNVSACHAIKKTITNAYITPDNINTVIGFIFLRTTLWMTGAKPHKKEINNATNM
jgi:hypothetical protein